MCLPFLYYRKLECNFYIKSCFNIEFPNIELEGIYFRFFCGVFSYWETKIRLCNAYVYSFLLCGVGWNDSGNGFSWLQNIDVSGASSFAWLDGEQGWELGFMPLVGKFQADVWVSSQEWMFWECQWLLSSLFRKPAWYSRQCLFAQSCSFYYSGCCFMAAGSRHESVGLNPVFMTPQKMYSFALSQLTKQGQSRNVLHERKPNKEIRSIQEDYMACRLWTPDSHMLSEHPIQH